MELTSLFSASRLRLRYVSFLWSGIRSDEITFAAAAGACQEVGRVGISMLFEKPGTCIMTAQVAHMLFFPTYERVGGQIHC